MLDIVTHLDYADYSIPLTVYFRWLYDTIGLTEWGMHLPIAARRHSADRGRSRLLARGRRRPCARHGRYCSRFPRCSSISAGRASLCADALAGDTSRSSRFSAGAFDRASPQAGRRRYIVTTFLGGYLHMTTLAFTLMPFVYFGIRTLRGDRADWRRLVRMGVATSIPLAIVLLPPVINDWFMFTAKAGVDSVTLAEHLAYGAHADGQRACSVSAGARRLHRRRAPLGCGGAIACWPAICSRSWPAVRGRSSPRARTGSCIHRSSRAISCRCCRSRCCWRPKAWSR